jgi:hypothetical protein
MPLDWEKALQNTDGSEELLIELAGVFLDECPEMMRQIRASIDAGDAPGLQLAAHSLKGSARIFAAPPVTDAAPICRMPRAPGRFFSKRSRISSWRSPSGAAARVRRLSQDKRSDASWPTSTSPSCWSKIIQSMRA